MMSRFCMLGATVAFTLLIAGGTPASAAGTTQTARQTANKKERPVHSPDQPLYRSNHPRTKVRHKQNLERIKQGPVDLLFLGDSITDRWTSAPLVWNKYFGKWKAANFGIGGDRTENVLWRLENGEIDGIAPKVVVLMIGTNNTHTNEPADIVRGIKRIIQVIHQKSPDSKVLLLAVFPREARLKDGKPVMLPVDRVKEINKLLPALAEPGRVEYLDISDRFLQNGHVPKTIMPDGVHLSDEGYEIWGKAVEPVIARMMGDKPAETAK